ncbi:hypothetical protein NP493_606g03032 [Ridgeia piscesae]|uniref:Fibrinogen C-terminal domain-containing protein n=1 Tax=Ridgeia piscesae TaxID=27915 RepID=A0AAD9NNW0_RIDPI|nr:hypothetical protein NP493_606g03032 [Ridgeia piscesae]
MGPLVCFLLASGVFSCIPAPVSSQCTTKYCADDDKDDTVLTAMVARLQETVDQLRQEQRHSMEQLRQDHQRSTEQLQQQLNFTAEQLRQDQEQSTDQLQQQFNHSVVEQQKHLTRLEETIASRTENARDCADLQKKGYTTSGVYYIYIAKLKRKVKVFCDQETDNGGWTVFQKRQDGSVDFYRDWKHYKEGFGDVGGEYWLGE